MARPRADPRRLAPPALAAALALAYLLWQPPSLDLAAAEYRASLFAHDGFALWDLRWYGGHHLPGYSVLAPPLGAWLGPRLAGALAAVAAAALFERLARERFGVDAWLGALWFAAGTATTLLSGRITFALGLVPALGALLALARAERARTAGRRRALLAGALGLALLTPLASPVAALFLALAGAAYALGAGRSRPVASALPERAPAAAGPRRAAGLALAAAALAPVAALAVAFPEGGHEPFAASAFWPVLAFAALALALLPRAQRTLRAAAALYALGCLAAFALDTPVGGNATRLGALCAGPLAALALWPRRRRALALLLPLALWWQWSAAVDDVRTASGDPTVHAAYYAPLLAFLARTAPKAPAGRVEIPFTRLHWEARWVAERVPLARGWERQLDVATNPLFYDGTLTPASYRAWLARMAVRWVALPATRLDYSAQAEARLIRGGLPYLRLAWRDRDWRVYAVRDATPLVAPPAHLLAAGADGLELEVPRAGGRGILLRVRWTPYWAVTAGDACVAPAGDWTRLRVRAPGRIRLATRFSLARIGARGPRCSGTDPDAPDEDGVSSG